MPQMFRVPEVAAKLSLSVKTVYRLIERGKLGHHKIGHAVRVSDKQLAAFIANTERDAFDRPDRLMKWERVRRLKHIHL